MSSSQDAAAEEPPVKRARTESASLQDLRAKMGVLMEKACAIEATFTERAQAVLGDLLAQLEGARGSLDSTWAEHCDALEEATAENEAGQAQIQQTRQETRELFEFVNTTV